MFYTSKKPLPKYLASVPSVSSIRRSWLYFAVLSVLETEPVLIWPAFKPTERSLMKTSSVSPDLWDTMTPKREFFANSIVSIVSESVPIWFNLIKIEFAESFLIPVNNLFLFVTKRSSPTIWTFWPIVFVSSLKPSQSFSSNGSSIETTGNFLQISSQYFTNWSVSSFLFHLLTHKIYHHIIHLPQHQLQYKFLHLIYIHSFQ